jgi:hypothetical protein
VPLWTEALRRVRVGPAGRPGPLLLHRNDAPARRRDRDRDPWRSVTPTPRPVPPSGVQAGHEVDLVGRLACREREVATAAGAVRVRQPRVNDKRIDEVTGERGGSPRQSCRRGRGSPPAWRRCSRCCICTACPRGLGAGVGAVPRLGRGPVRGDGHPAHRAVAGRHRRVPRVLRVVGRSAARLQTPWHAGAGAASRAGARFERGKLTHGARHADKQVLTYSSWNPRLQRNVYGIISDRQSR